MFRSGSAPSVECYGKPVEAGIPHPAVPRHPIVEFAERLRAQRVESPAALGSNNHEPSVLQDAELPRHTRLADVNGLDQLTHRALAAPERVDQAPAGRVGQDLKDVGHGDILLEHIEAREFEPKTTLVSPFDNLICDRNRTLALWGFDFKLEIYVPKSKRWGYFVMPLLHGDRIIARFDLAVDRNDGILNVIGERWEPGWDGRRRPTRATKRALDDLASFLGVDVRRQR